MAGILHFHGGQVHCRWLLSLNREKHRISPVPTFGKIISASDGGFTSAKALMRVWISMTETIAPVQHRLRRP